jgi:hypothetical protein
MKTIMIREGCLSPETGILCLNTSYACFCEFSNELVDSFDLFRYEGIKKIAAVKSVVSVLHTFPPPTRFGGSATLRVSNRGVRSTPSSSAESFSMGFFLAFMMFGSEAYRGSGRVICQLRDWGI